MRRKAKVIIEGGHAFDQPLDEENPVLNRGRSYISRPVSYGSWRAKSSRSVRLFLHVQ